MEAGHIERRKMTLFVGLLIAVSMFGATPALSQRLHTATAPDAILYRLNTGGPTVASIDDGPDWLSDNGFHGTNGDGSSCGLTVSAVLTEGI